MNHDRRRRLHELVIALVSRLESRRAGGNTPFPQGPVLRTFRAPLPGYPLLGLELLRQRGQGRKAPIRRVSNQRSPVIPDSVIVLLRTVIESLAVGTLEAGLQTFHIRPYGQKQLIAKCCINLPADEHLLGFCLHRLHFSAGQHGMGVEFHWDVRAVWQCCWPGTPANPDVHPKTTAPYTAAPRPTLQKL